MDADMDPETVVKIEGYCVKYIDENDEGSDSDDPNGLHSFQNCSSVSDAAVVDCQQNSNLEHIAKLPAGPELLQLAKAKEIIKKDSTTQDRHKCSIPNCTKSFPTKRKLRIHFNYDHGQNWFKCHLCEKTYPTRGGVGRHLSIHFPARPHLCNLCPKSFKLSHSLVSHKQRVHRTSRTISTTVPKSQPDSEKQQSSFNNAVVENQIKGEGALHSVSNAEVVEQCHKCPISNCSKTFSTSKKLSAHKNREHGKTSFKCDLCEKSFLSKAVLETHFITHSLARPHRCRLCLKPFKYQNNLWSHYRIVHQITRENKRGRPTSHSAKQSQLGSATAAETLIIPDLINPRFPANVAQANSRDSGNQNKSELVQYDVEGGVKKVRRRKQVHAKT